MQFNFFKNLCRNFLKNEYRPIFGSFESEAITNASKYIAFSKISGTTLYTIFIVRKDLISDYQKFIENYASKISANIHISGCDKNGNSYSLRFSNKIFISIIISDNIDNEIINFSTITDIIGNEEFIELRWIADTSHNELKIYGNQPKRLNGIENIIFSSFNDETDNSATTLSHEYSKAAFEKQKKLKSLTTYGTYSMITLLIVISIIQFLFSIESNDNIIEQLGMLYPIAVFEDGQYYRLFTSIFLHSGITHLASNCLSLYIFGSRVERYFGSGYYMFLFLISGLIASVATLFLSSPEIPSLGASGAIFGLEGAVLAYIIINKNSVDGFDLNLIMIFSIIGIGFGFIQPGINNIAHIAGFISGIIISIIYLKKH